MLLNKQVITVTVWTNADKRPTDQLTAALETFREDDRVFDYAVTSGSEVAQVTEDDVDPGIDAAEAPYGAGS